MNGKILHFLFAVGLFISPIAAVAQPVLTVQSNGMRTGYFLYSGTQSITTLAPTGANVIWDYSYIVADSLQIYNDTGYVSVPDTSSITVITPPANNPQITSLFPQANFFLKQYNKGDSNNINGYQFNPVKTTGAGWTMLGEIDQDANFNSYDTVLESPPAVFINFPFTYNSFQINAFTDQDPNYYYDSLTSNTSITADSSNIDSLWGSAYGTLKLPNKTYINVLMVKNTSSGEWNWFGEYDFFAPGYPFPVFSINQDSDYYSGVVTYYASYLLNPNGALPLSLLTFTGTLQHNTSILLWQTTNEINTQSFAVERSADGASYTALGSVPATDTPGPNNYSYTDTKPLEGDNYYRLKMYDKDGAFTYSRIVKLNNGGGVFAIQVYPNPAEASTTLAFNSLTAGKYSVTVASMDGKTVKRLEGVAATGINSLQLDINDLAKGVYMVTFNSADGTHTLKFVKE